MAAMAQNSPRPTQTVRSRVRKGPEDKPKGSGLEPLGCLSVDIAQILAASLDCMQQRGNHQSAGEGVTG